MLTDKQAFITQSATDFLLCKLKVKLKTNNYNFLRNKIKFDINEMFIKTIIFLINKN